MGELAEFLFKNDANFRKTRIPALFADFRSQKNLNPDGYQANVLAWQLALSRLASEGLLSRGGLEPNRLLLDVDESLRKALDSGQYGQPQALGAAINDAVANKDLLPQESWVSSLQGGPSYQPWLYLPYNVIRWTAAHVGLMDGVGGNDKLPVGRYVITKNLATAAEILRCRLSSYSTRFERVFTHSQFQSIFSPEMIGDHRLSDDDWGVLMTYVSKFKRMIDYDAKTVRILGPNEQDGVTAEDASMASIKELVVHLTHQIDVLNQRIDELEREARAAVLRGNRIKALASIKAKKLAEASLTQRYTTLNQLEEVASKLQVASDNIQLVEVMESSAAALANLNAKVGTVERVDTVVDRLREQMKETDEVGAILAESTGAVVDEDEISDELEAMEKEQKDKEEEEHELAVAQKQLDDLPALPVDGIEERARRQSPTTETGIDKLTLEESKT